MLPGWRLEGEEDEGRDAWKGVVTSLYQDLMPGAGESCFAGEQDCYLAITISSRGGSGGNKT